MKNLSNSGELELATVRLSSHKIFEKLWKTLKSKLEPSVEFERLSWQVYFPVCGKLEFITNRLKFVAHKVIDLEFHSLQLKF